MNCRILEKLVIPYIEDTLDEEQTKAFEEHLHACESCQQELEEVREVVGVLKAEAEDSPIEEPDLWEKISGTILENDTRDKKSFWTSYPVLVGAVAVLLIVFSIPFFLHDNNNGRVDQLVQVESERTPETTKSPLLATTPKAPGAAGNERQAGKSNEMPESTVMAQAPSASHKDELNGGEWGTPAPDEYSPTMPGQLEAGRGSQPSAPGLLSAPVAPQTASEEQQESAQSTMTLPTEKSHDTPNLAKSIPPGGVVSRTQPVPASHPAVNPAGMLSALEEQLKSGNIETAKVLADMLQTMQNVTQAQWYRLGEIEEKLKRNDRALNAYDRAARGENSSIVQKAKANIERINK